jgi:hypothetical protein
MDVGKNVTCRKGFYIAGQHSAISCTPSRLPSDSPSADSLSLGWLRYLLGTPKSMSVAFGFPLALIPQAMRPPLVGQNSRVEPATTVQSAILLRRKQEPVKRCLARLRINILSEVLAITARHFIAKCLQS